MKTYAWVNGVSYQLTRVIPIRRRAGRPYSPTFAAIVQLVLLKKRQNGQAL